jgi:hypothetical protein
MSIQALENSASPFAYEIGQRVKYVTGEKGRIFGRWLGLHEARYAMERDSDCQTIVAFESELSLIPIPPRW